MSCKDGLGPGCKPYACGAQKQSTGWLWSFRHWRLTRTATQMNVQSPFNAKPHRENSAHAGDLAQA